MDGGTEPTTRKSGGAFFGIRKLLTGLKQLRPTSWRSAEIEQTVYTRRGDREKTGLETLDPSVLFQIP